MNAVSELWRPSLRELRDAVPTDHGTASAPTALLAVLPARPHRRIALAVAAPMAAALRDHLGPAMLIPSDPDDRIDDISPGSVGLLVVDTRLHPVEPLRRLLAPRAAVVTIGTDGDLLLSPGHTGRVGGDGTGDLLWRRGWPLPVLAPAGHRLRGLALVTGRATPRVEITGEPCASLAEAIGDDLAVELGEHVELTGVACVPQLELRFRGSTDYAVRVTVPRTDRPEPAYPAALLRDVPALGALLPADVASGSTAGWAWSAVPWASRARRDGSSRRARRHAATDAGRMADALGGVVTGRTGGGWAARWLASVPAVPERLRGPFECCLRRLADGLPTGWVHGDLGGRHADPRSRDGRWQDAVPDGPLGLDRLLLSAQHRADRFGGDLAARCVELAEHPQLLPHRVAGRRWSGWDRRTRVALALAGYLAHLRATGARTADVADTDWERLGELVAPAAPTSPRFPGRGDPTPAADPSLIGRRGRRSALRGAAWLGAGAFVVKASQTAILLVLAALLDPSAMGVLAVGSLILNAASAFTDLGSSTALVYWRADAEEAGRSALTLALGVSLLVVTGAWVAAPWFAGALHTGPDGTGVIRGLMLALPFTAVAGVSRELLRRDMAFARRVLPDIVSSLCSVPVALVLALRGHGVYALVGSQLVQAVLVMLLCWAARRPVRPGWRREHVDGLVAYGRHLAGANIVQLLMLNVDYLVVARVLGSGPLGQYSIAFRLAYMPYLLGAVVIGGAAFPYLCRLGEGAVGRAAEQVGSLTLALLLPLYVGMATLAPQLELLGHQWAPAVPAVPWLAAYGLLLGLVQMCLVPLNSVSRTRDTFVLSLLHLVLLTALLLWLAPHGVTAVAIGQLAAVLVTAMAALALTRRHVSGFRPTALLAGLGPAVAGGAVMAALIVTGRAVLPWSRVSAPGLLVLGVPALAAYVAVLWLLTGRRPLDRLLGGAA